MIEPSRTREKRDRHRGQLRQMLIDLANDYDVLLASLDEALRARHAKAIETHLESLRQSMQAVEQYEVLKRALAPK